MPIKDLGARLPLADLRLAVYEAAFSLFVAGQEDAPLLAGETCGRLAPLRCEWRVGEPKVVGEESIREIHATLWKQTAGSWVDLIQTWYV